LLLNLKDSLESETHAYVQNHGAVGITTGCRLDDRGKVKTCSLLHIGQTGCDAYTTSSYSLCTWGSSLEGKRQMLKADRSLPASAEVKKLGSLCPLPHTPSWRITQLVKHRNNFTFSLFYKKISNYF
jgi:hypothetical protein